jgi:hypothetical protein
MHIFMHHLSLYFNYNLRENCADTGSCIRGQIRIYEGKFGYLRANTDIYPAMTAFTDQYSLPNIFFDIGQL